MAFASLITWDAIGVGVRCRDDERRLTAKGTLNRGRVFFHVTQRCAGMMIVSSRSFRLKLFSVRVVIPWFSATAGVPSSSCCSPLRTVSFVHYGQWLFQYTDWIWVSLFRSSDDIVMILTTFERCWVTGQGFDSFLIPNTLNNSYGYRCDYSKQIKGKMFNIQRAFFRWSWPKKTMQTLNAFLQIYLSCWVRPSLLGRSYQQAFALSGIFSRSSFAVIAAACIVL